MKTKIQNQFFLYYLFLTILPLIALSYFSYFNIKTNSQKELINSISFDLRVSQSSFDTLYARLQKYMDILTNSTTFYNTVMSTSTDFAKGRVEQAKFQASMNFEPQFKSLFATDDLISAVLVVVQGRVVYSYRDFVSVTNDLKQDPVIINTVNTPDMHWFSNQNSPFGLFEGRYTVITKNIYDILGNNPMDSICQLVILIPQSKVTEMLNTHLRFADSIIRVTDKNNHIVVSNEGDPQENEGFFQRLSQQTLMDPYASHTEFVDDYLVLNSYSNTTHWHTVQLSPSKYVTKASSAIIVFTTFLVIGLLIFMFLFSFFISKEIILPIKRLAFAMKKVGEKNITIEVAHASGNEIAEITNDFNQMVKRIDTLFKLTIEIEGKKRKSEIEMLKYQINPHFLYNTINSIRFSAMNHKDEVTAHMLVTLSRLLRNTLSHTGNDIPLELEIQNIKDYILLQQLRYSNKLNVDYSIQEDTEHLLVPHMILQPIVENSILHGISHRLNLGEFASIMISSYIVDSNIHIVSIYDNGVGIAASILSSILDQHHPPMVSDTLHIGLLNIHKRIRLLYGEPYGIELESVQGEYCCVKLILPILKETEKNNDQNHYSRR